MLVREHGARLRGFGDFGQDEEASGSSNWLQDVTSFFSTAVVPGIQAIKGVPLTATPVRSPAPTPTFGAGAVSKGGIAGLSTTTVVAIGAAGLVAYYMLKGKRGRA